MRLKPRIGGWDGNRSVVDTIVMCSFVLFHLEYILGFFFLDVLMDLGGMSEWCGYETGHESKHVGTDSIRRLESGWV